MDPEYFALTDFRLLPQMSDTTKYPEARVLAAAAYVTAIIEGAVGTSFVPRSKSKRYDGGGSGIVLDELYVLDSPAPTATANGVAISSADLVVDDGILYRLPAGATSPVSWPIGKLNIAVTYSAGYSATPPGDIREAAMKGTRAHLLATNSNAAIDDRRMSLQTELGTINYTIASAENPTGYPEVDAVINSWRQRLNTVTYP